jgi:hypothetical protein
MHSFNFNSCISFPFLFCQLAEGFLMRQEGCCEEFLVYYCTHKAKRPKSIRGTISEDTQAHL